MSIRRWTDIEDRNRTMRVQARMVHQDAIDGQVSSGPLYVRGSWAFEYLHGLRSQIRSQWEEADPAVEW